MSGWPRWASVAPSHRLTSAWTIDCGWTTTSMRSYGVPNRWWASMTSRPLFIRVAESIVILPPIAHAGWASASSTVTPSRSARRRPRNGPPAAGRTRRSAAPGGGRDESLARPGRLVGHELVQRRVLGVDRHDPGARRLGELHAELAPDDQRLLVGQGEVDALPQRGDGRPQPGRADERVEDEVGLGLEHEAHEPLGAAEHLAAGPRLGGARGGVGVGERDARHAEPAGRGDERLPRPAGRHPDDLQVVRARHDVERLRADRARRAEDEQAARHG